MKMRIFDESAFAYHIHHLVLRFTICGDTPGHPRMPGRNSSGSFWGYLETKPQREIGPNLSAEWPRRRTVQSNFPENPADITVKSPIAHNLVLRRPSPPNPCEADLEHCEIDLVAIDIRALTTMCVIQFSSDGTGVEYGTILHERAA